MITTRRLKDRKGYYDGRRIYKMRTMELQQKPIPQFIRVCDCGIRVDYYGQPTRCFLCKKYGHIKAECPESVETPLLLYGEGSDDIMIVEPSTQNQKTMRSDAGLSEQRNEHGEQTVQAQGLNDNSVIDDLINNSAEQDHQSTATSTPITHHALNTINQRPTKDRKLITRSSRHRPLKLARYRTIRFSRPTMRAPWPEKNDSTLQTVRLTRTRSRE